ARFLMTGTGTQCPSVRGMRSLTTTNLVGRRNPALAKVRLGFMSSSVGFAVENLLPCWERREFNRSRSLFLEGHSSERAGTIAIPPTTKIISNTNSKKFMIVLRLDESDDAPGRSLSTPERVLSDQTHDHDWSDERTIPGGL